MKTLKDTAVGAFLVLNLLASTAVTAETPTEYDPWYFGVGLGLSTLKPDTSVSIYQIDDDSDFGYKLFAGYDWSEKIAIEGYYADLGEAKMSPNGKIGYTDLGISGLYHFYQHKPAQTGFGAFAKAGLGFMKNDSDLKYRLVNSSHWMLGIGAGYRLKNGLKLRADFDLFDEDSQLVSISVIKYFGGSKSSSQQPVVKEPESPKPAPVAAPVIVVIADSDADGIPDDQDACPGTIADLTVDSRGCAVSWVLQGVEFTHNKDILTPDSQNILNQVVSELVAQKAYRKVRVEGHTDAAGPAAYNQRLSLKRAKAVRNYLINHGVEASILSAIGRGEEQPAADNATTDGRAKNRRVELHWQ